MPVVDIRVVRVAMLDGGVAVPMAVLFPAGHARFVCMLVVFVMHVLVRVLQHLMLVLMGMVFREMQPYAQGHQSRRNPKWERGRL